MNGKKRILLIRMLHGLISYKTEGKEEAMIRDELLQEFPLIFANYDMIIEEIKNNPDKYKTIDGGKER